MPSVRSRVFGAVLRRRHWLRLRRSPEAFDATTSITAFRERAERMAGMLARLPEGVEASPVEAGGVAAEWVRRRGGAEAPVILYVHGGGYVSGSCRDHRAMVAKFVLGCEVGVLQYDYRLAPEHPFPAAVEDSVAVYRWLLEQGHSPSRVAVVGESAGGGLALALLLALKERGLPQPAAAVAMSPWTDLACTGDSYRTRAGVCLSPPGSWEVFSAHYLGGADAKNPLASPLYGALEGLPPLFITVGGDEILLDDGRRFGERARAAGVEVVLEVGEGLLHCYPLLPSFLPESRAALERIFRFVKAHLGEKDPTPAQP